MDKPQRRQPSQTGPAPRHARAEAGPRYRRWLILGFCLVGLGGLAVAGRTALDGFRERILLDGRSTDATPVLMTIGGKSLAIPGNMIRFDPARRGGPVARIDLQVNWPDLDGITAANATQFHPAPGAPAPLVYVTIQPGDDAGDSTSRLDEVYTRFFSDEAWAGPSGLVGVRLDEKSGYAGEDLFFQPESDHPFVARCLAPRDGDVPPTCIREIRVENLSVTYRFDKALLDDWVDLDPALIKRVEGFLGG